MKLNIVLADDHQMFRHALRALLEKEPHLNIVAEAADHRLTHGRAGSSQGGLQGGENVETRSQNSCSRATRRSGGLPAISAPLMAPIDTPATQSGTAPAAAKPS